MPADRQTDVTIALNWTRMTIPDIPYFAEQYLLGTTVDQRSTSVNLHLPGTTSEYFNDNDDLFQFTFAKNIKRDLSLGWYFFKIPIDMHFAANIKYIRRDIRNNTGTGTGFDLALLLKTELSVLLDFEWLGDLSFGANFKDLGGTSVTWDTESKHEDEIPQTKRIGLALTQPVEQFNSVVILATDVNYEYQQIWNYGLDIEYNKLVSLRLGKTRNDYTSGLSLKIFKFTIDYAFLNNSLGLTNRVGIRFQY